MQELDYNLTRGIKKAELEILVKARDYYNGEIYKKNKEIETLEQAYIEFLNKGIKK